MNRATQGQKAERLNHARGLLQRFAHPSDVVERMVGDYSISQRQAYRYLQKARRLKKPVPVEEAKVAFTVKVSPGVVERVRGYAARRGLSLSEVVSRALQARLARR